MKSYTLLILLAFMLCLYPAVAFGDYPPTIDLSALSGVDATEILGENENDYLGQGIAHGDFNGDGVEDIIAGAFKASPNGIEDAGIVYVFWGSTDFEETRTIDLAVKSDVALQVWGNEYGGQLGSSVGAGDINGDGIDDLIMGAWHKDGPERFDCGAVYVCFGASDLAETDIIDLSEDQVNVVTIWGSSGGHLIFDDEPSHSLVTPGSELGSNVDAGDINGDGYDDILVGAWKENPLERTDAGADYVIFGSSDFGSVPVIDLAEDNAAAISFYGQITFAGYGSQLGFDGAVDDVDADGYEDLIMGARFADYAGIQDCGELYIFWGGSAIGAHAVYDLSVSNPNITVVHGANSIDYAGTRLSTGDINGDGYPDVLADSYGARREEGGWYGKAYVVFGGPYLKESNGLTLGDNEHVLSIWGQASQSSFGKPSAGDINGDGIDDLLVQGDRQYNDLGKGFIIWGSEELDKANTIDLAMSPGNITSVMGTYQDGKLGGLSMSADFNNDGYEDIVYTAHTASPLGRKRSGVLHVIWGMSHDPGDPDYSHFHVADTTGPSADVVITSSFDITGLSGTDGPIEFGFFTSGGICAGVGTWEGDEITISVYGDSGDHSQITGYESGEMYQVRIWVPSLGREYDILPYFSDGEGYFIPYGSSTIRKIAVDNHTIVEQGEEDTPQIIKLSPNYPNPFNPVTSIPFTVTESSKVSLTVYNVLGERIKTLADNTYSAGSYEIIWDASDVSSGVYFCRLEAAGTVQTQRMLLVR